MLKEDAKWNIKKKKRSKLINSNCINANDLYQLPSICNNIFQVPDLCDNRSQWVPAQASVCVSAPPVGLHVHSSEVNAAASLTSHPIQGQVY